MYEATPFQSFWYRQFRIGWTISRLLGWLMRPSRARLLTRRAAARPHPLARAPGRAHGAAREPRARVAPRAIEQAEIGGGADRDRARRPARVPQRRRIERERLLGRERFARAEHRAAPARAPHRGGDSLPRIARAIGCAAARGPPPAR